MNYILMNKNTPVLSMEIINNTVIAIKDIYNEKHAPFGVDLAITALNKWWKSRCIPASRDGLKDSLSILGVDYPDELLLKSFALSLSDQYWVKSEADKFTWADINFFTNDFSEDVGEAIFAGNKSKEGDLDLCSPDNTSDGWLKKKWITKGRERYLIKAGSRPFRQEPFNEIIATSIFKRLGVEHTQYKLCEISGEPCSICGNFITPDTELVTAWQMYASEKQSDDISVYQHLADMTVKNGLADMRGQIDAMLAVDYMIANTDRHMSNFGFIRDVNTLEFIGMAPIYDSGTSLWHNVEEINFEQISRCRPFRNDHEEQIKLVQDFSKIDFSRLRGIEEEASEILKEKNIIRDDRRSALCYALAARVKMLEKHIADRCF